MKNRMRTIMLLLLTMLLLCPIQVLAAGGAGRRKWKGQCFFPHIDAGKRGEDVCTAPVEQLQL